MDRTPLARDLTPLKRLGLLQGEPGADRREPKEKLPPHCGRAPGDESVGKAGQVVRGWDYADDRGEYKDFAIVSYQGE